MKQFVTDGRGNFDLRQFTNISVSLNKPLIQYKDSKVQFLFSKVCSVHFTMTSCA
jgi:hypothetical protein